MSKLSTTAMVLAAGKGERMRPLTLETPKPLLEVGGRTMLDLALDKLAATGIERAVVNTCYLADQIEEHLKKRSNLEIIISREKKLLDTGGGVKNALENFTAPFFALNADLPWIDEGEPALQRMAAYWDPEKMDVLLLVMPTQKTRGFGPDGDFVLGRDGHLRRKNAPTPRPTVMLSAQIVKPELYEAIDKKVFSNNEIWDAAEGKGRLYGIAHEGGAYHVGTPQDLAKANTLLASGQGWQVA